MRDARAEFLFCLFNLLIFLTLSLSSLSWHLKVPVVNFIITTTHTIVILRIMIIYFCCCYSCLFFRCYWRTGSTVSSSRCWCCTWGQQCSCSGYHSRRGSYCFLIWSCWGWINWYDVYLVISTRLFFLCSPSSFSVFFHSFLPSFHSPCLHAPIQRFDFRLSFFPSFLSPC